MTRLAVFVLAWATLFNTVLGDEPAIDDIAVRISGAIEDLVQRNQIAGAQVVLGDVDSIQFTNSFGVLSVDDKRPVDDETLFCIGSCSKMFAAAVVLSLVADGTLELDTPIDRWLPEFSSPSLKDGPAKRAPTLRELLCHRSGIYSQRNSMTNEQTKWIRDFELTLAESVAGIAQEPLLSQPGESYAYSGAGYCVLGRVAEAASGLPFNDLLSRRICEPLGLQSATYFPRSDDNNVASGHSLSDGRLRISVSTPHHLKEKHRLPLIGGSLYCSASESARFAQMLLSNGNFNDKSVLTSEHWREMTRVQAARPGGGYGFGIAMKVDNDTKKTTVLTHSGALNGSLCEIWMDLRSGRFGVINYSGGRQNEVIANQLKSWVHSSGQQPAEPESKREQPETTGPTEGSLVIMGGGGGEIESVFGRFVELAGGKDAKIVIVPTAASSDESYDYANHKSLRLAREKLGLRNVSVLHTHNPEEADTEEFAAPVRAADGVWFTGGRQWRIADAYRGTLTERAFHEVLERGGVIGGSSAGATIQGSFLARGDTNGNSLMVGDHQHGFGFVSNCAIDQHLVARGRQAGLIDVLTDPEGRMEASFDRSAMLGLGIDEDTAIVVQGNQLEVIGKPDGRLLVYDPRSWQPDTPDNKKYQTLFVGAKYDLARRLKINTNQVQRESKHPQTCVGFYKEIFMSGGVQLSSRRRLPAANTLGLSYEYYAGKDMRRQNELIAGNKNDTNGVLLYPDGQPRFRMIYVNGGAATLHGKSLEKRGREVLRQFYSQGGSYCGSCAGSFLSGRNTDKKTDPRLGYLHIFPFNTLNTGMKRERVGHYVPADSPLMKYRDFGGDGYVADIYHNNGNWLNTGEGKHLEVTEILATYDAPTHRSDGGAAVWAYKADEQTGRIVNIGSHPEAITYGERLDLTEACFLYALDGVASPKIKGLLTSGVPRKMDKKTSDNDPEHAKIGDCQYHHFAFEVDEEVSKVTVQLEGQAGIDFHLYLNQDTPAIHGNATFSNLSQGSEKRIEADLEPGKWIVSVQCATTVHAIEDEARESFVYSGHTEVLNGVSYQLTMTAK